jgi:vacuolar-type H+-ATPase subunit E/Vma4
MGRWRRKRTFDRVNTAVQNLITAVEDRIRHTPRTEENYDWQLLSVFIEYLQGKDIISTGV